MFVCESMPKFLYAHSKIPRMRTFQLQTTLFHGIKTFEFAVKLETLLLKDRDQIYSPRRLSALSTTSAFFPPDRHIQAQLREHKIAE